MTVQIVIPVYNEAGTVAAVVRAARGHAPVLVVDDGSTDASGAAARAAGADVLRHPRRRGKAAALRTGIAAARDRGATIVVTLDGDGQHDVRDLPGVLAAADTGTIVVGGRLAGGAGLPPGRLNAIRVAGFFVNWVSGLRVMDTQSGFRAYPAALFGDIHPRRGGFVFETEVLIAAAARGWRVVEIPVTPIPRAARRSRFRPAVDGAAIAAYLAARVMRRWGVEAVAAAGAVGAIFRRDRLRARHAAMLAAAAAYGPVTPLWGAAMTTTAGRRAIARISGWWRHPRRRRAATAAAASAATPVLLALVVLRAAGGRLVPDLVSPLVRRLYAQERLAVQEDPPPAAPPAARAEFRSGGDVMTTELTYDVAIIGGGPGGSSVSTLLADAGLRVAVFEREVFPRFHVGESLMPATLWLLDKLGAREAVENAGFIKKYGAEFYDERLDKGHAFYFLRDRPWPNYSYEVPRAEFDTILLENAKKHGVAVYQPATVDTIAFDGRGATLGVVSEGERLSVRAAFVVDASGRDGFLATRIGRRDRMPNLGKVALFGHFRGARRFAGQDEGNIRIYVCDEGWFWWIPLAGDVTSVGAVMHARTVQAWSGDADGLFAHMVSRCRVVAEGMPGAERVGDLHRAANFAYINTPVVGDRHLMIGDAIAFTDPIFSGGVFIAMRSGQLAAEVIARAFRDGRFDARRFRGYEREVWRGIRPFFKFIHKYYEPAFFELFLSPKNLFGMVDGVLAVLSGGAFIKLTWHTRFSLALLFAIGRVHTFVRRLQGRSVESRLEW